MSHPLEKNDPYAYGDFLQLFINDSLLQAQNRRTKIRANRRYVFPGRFLFVLNNRVPVVTDGSMNNRRLTDMI